MSQYGQIWTPHAYQRKSLRFILERPAAGLLLDPGMGKTSIMLAGLKVMQQKALVVAPLRVCYEAWPREIEKWGAFRKMKIAILHGPKKEEALCGDADLYCINPEGLPWLVPQWSHLDDTPKVLIVDECFVEGTPISTPTGLRPIEEIAAREFVETPKGARRVRHVFEGCSQVLVVLELEDGTKITTTPNHPIATTKGWCAASALQAGTDLLRLVQDPLQAEELPTAMLQSLLQNESHVAELFHQASQENRRQNESLDEGSSSVESRDSHASDHPSPAQRISASYATQTEGAGRERTGSDAPRAASEEGAGGRLEAAVRHQWLGESSRISDVLQDGSSTAQAEDRHRDRRLQPQRLEAACAGSKEGPLARTIRVASASISQLRDPIPVFNLEVEGDPYYCVEGVVVHNSTKFKHTQTQRFKLLKQILPSFHRRYILTGTPIPNGMIDLFGQVYILDLGASLGRFITHYRNTFFERSGFMGYDWTILPGAEERIYERLRPLALRLDAEDYLHLPPVITNTLMGQLPPKARAATTQLELTYMLELEGREVTAVNAAALSIKLRQITGGFVYDPLGESHKIHEAKIEQLEDLLEEISGQPTLVAYQFDHEGQALAKRLSAPLLGEKTPKQVRELLEGWTRGEVPVLLVHPASAGHGLNLQAGGRHLIWYSLPWDQEHYDQLLRRLWRQGQTKPVYQHHLVMQDSVDELILTALSRKQKVQDEFLSHLKRGVKQWRSSRIVPVAELNSKATSSAIRAGNRRAPAASPSK